MRIRVVLPQHLQTLAGSGREVAVDTDGAASVRTVLDALEAQHPQLRGTIREHGTLKRRPRVRFFAAGLDVSHESLDAELPKAVTEEREPFMIVGAVAGG